MSNSESVIEVSKSVESGKQDDVNCVAQARLTQEPSVGEMKIKEENKSGNSAVGLNETKFRKRRKTRRGKSKRQKIRPYTKLSWQERRQQGQKRAKYANRVRADLFAHGQPVAPYNTNQFLMDDHNDLQNLDDQLNAVKGADRLGKKAPLFQRPRRARDSSLSVDSDDDYFYSSPEDEEEFLTKEFSNTYEDLHAERLSQMSKSELIQECMRLELKVDALEQRLKKEQNKDIQGQAFDSDADNERKVVNVDYYEEEINKLVKENDQLRCENERLRSTCGKQDSAGSSSSSVDSESDSTCSSASNSSDSESSDGESGTASESDTKPPQSRTADMNCEEAKE